MLSNLYFVCQVTYIKIYMKSILCKSFLWNILKPAKQALMMLKRQPCLNDFPIMILLASRFHAEFIEPCKAVAHWLRLSLSKLFSLSCTVILFVQDPLKIDKPVTIWFSGLKTPISWFWVVNRAYEFTARRRLVVRHQIMTCAG